MIYFGGTLYTSCNISEFFKFKKIVSNIIKTVGFTPDSSINTQLKEADFQMNYELDSLRLGEAMKCRPYYNKCFCKSNLPKQYNNFSCSV